MMLAVKAPALVMSMQVALQRFPLLEAKPIVKCRDERADVRHCHSAQRQSLLGAVQGSIQVRHVHALARLAQLGGQQLETGRNVSERVFLIIIELETRLYDSFADTDVARVQMRAVISGVCVPAACMLRNAHAGFRRCWP